MAPPPRAGADWRGFAETLLRLGVGEAGWPAEIAQARRWYEPHVWTAPADQGLICGGAMIVGKVMPLGDSSRSRLRVAAPLVAASFNSPRSRLVARPLATASFRWRCGGSEDPDGNTNRISRKISVCPRITRTYDVRLQQEEKSLVGTLVDDG